MNGLLIVVSGFSGVGKGTLMKELLNRWPEQYALSISATSRKPRVGEEDGREYFFVTTERFEELIEKDLLLEHCRYGTNYYGTPREYVEQKLSEGKNVILEIEVQGGLQIKEKYPDTFLLYVIPPSAKELYQRLVNRNTESQEDIDRRMKRAVEETEFLCRYDCITVNDDFETCLEEIHREIQSRQKAVYERRLLTERLRNELTEITKGE